MMMRELK